jgi:hypothetical protein
MIVMKIWESYRKEGTINERSLWKGWYLFGIIPIYIRQVTPWKMI